MLLSLLASTAAFTSVVLAAYWVTHRPAPTAEARVRALAYGAGTEGSFGERMVAPPLEALGHALFSILPAGIMARTEKRLEVGGQPMSAGAFLSLCLLLAAILPLAGLGVAFLVSGGTLSAAVIPIMACLALLGVWAPFHWLRMRVRRRQLAMRKRLPDALDLLMLCVEAGLGLDAAFRRVSGEMEGPFAEEIRQMLHEVSLGKPRREALLEMAARTQIPEVEVVVNAVIQSQQMGSSLSQTLHSQSQVLRLRRRQRAEQVARQASVKMAFPLVLCMMPSLFIVVLGPIAIDLVKVLGD
jgi:tight adherence protein C